MINTSTVSTFTSSRIFELIKFLLEKRASIQEIKKFLETKHAEEYSTTTIYKYLRTMKYSGIEIVKEDEKFYINKVPFNFEFSQEEINGLIILSTYLDTLTIQEEKDDIQRFVDNYLKFASDELVEYFHTHIKHHMSLKQRNEEESRLINQFNQYLKDDQKVEITYLDSNKEEIKVIVDPIEIKYKNDETFFIGFNSHNGYMTSVKPQYVVDIKQLPVKNHKNFIPVTTTYILKGKLAKIYNLKEGEKSLGLDDKGNYIVINQGESKEEILKRLMGYQDLCEVISPKTHRKELIDDLDTMIKYYE